MKILYKHIEKDKSGIFKVLTENDDDIFCINNVINVGDDVTTVSSRKVSKPGNNDGAAMKFKVNVELTICVEKKDYHSGDNTVRINGKNKTENEHVSIGQYHSHEISINQKLTIEKKFWNHYYIKLLKDAADPVKCSDVCAMLIEEGIANFFLINKFSTVLKGKIEKVIPKKKKGFIHVREKAENNFLTMAADLLLANINFNIIKCVVLGGPGFYKDDLMKHFTSNNVEKYQPLIKNREKFFIIDLPSAYRGSLNVLFKNETLMRKLENVKALEEFKLLENFFSIIDKNPHRAYYGSDHVERAAQHGAVESLLISDQLIRSSSEKERNRYFKIMKNVNDHAGKVVVFYSQHQTGKELNQHSGIAAILYFPMPEIEDIELDIAREIELLNIHK